MEKCVLIYDDDQEILAVCKAILKKHYVIETRTNCDNVVNDLLEIKPDVVLMDLWIPGIGGEKAISKIREIDAIKEVPVILFSANDETEKISKRVDANGYLKKPFDIAEFKATIEGALENPGVDKKIRTF